MEPMTLACRHCGAPLTAPAQSGVVTCEHCGAKLQLRTADPEPSSVEQKPEVIIVKEKDKAGFAAHAANFAPLVACMPFVVIIVLILAVLAFFALLICAGALA
jgi:hypothetical protein